MMARWWDGKPDEQYWLETTDRPDIGVDLKAPQRDDSGAEHPAYALIRDTREDDIVFHYYKAKKAIVAWSRVRGDVFAEDIVWAAHGSVARGAGVVPYRRPGWRVLLEGPFALADLVSLEDLRDREATVRAARDLLKDEEDRSLYFPFEISDKRPLRPTQFYLTKMPALLVDAIPELAVAGARPAAGTNIARESVFLGSALGLGLDFAPADEAAATSERDPFAVDPSLVDRGLRGHARTLNLLAERIEDLGYVPRLPRPLEPQYDLAWETPDAVYVAEVKSTTRRNEERQLRLGLGQVLRYRYLVQTVKPVIGVLAIENSPNDRSWEDVCAAVAIKLLWPQTLGRLE